MNIAENIKAKRLALGMTQEELASIVEVQRTMIVQLERGTKGLSLILAKKLSEVFNCTIDELVK